VCCQHSQRCVITLWLALLIVCARISLRGREREQNKLLIRNSEVAITMLSLSLFSCSFIVCRACIDACHTFIIAIRIFNSRKIERDQMIVPLAIILVQLDRCWIIFDVTHGKPHVMRECTQEKRIFHLPLRTLWVREWESIRVWENIDQSQSVNNSNFTR
jgi:hypothetical protein